MEQGLIREDQIPNYPEYLALGHTHPEPLLQSNVWDVIQQLQTEIQKLKTENHKLKRELETKN